MAEHEFENEAMRLFATPPRELDDGARFVADMERRVDAYLAMRRRVMFTCTLVAAAAVAFVLARLWSGLVDWAPLTTAENLAELGMDISLLSISAPPIAIALVAIVAMALAASSDARGI